MAAGSERERVCCLLVLSSVTSTVLGKWRQVLKDGVSPDTCTADLQAFLQRWARTPGWGRVQAAVAAGAGPGPGGGRGRQGMPVLYDAGGPGEAGGGGVQVGGGEGGGGLRGGSAAADGSEADERPDERRVAGREVVGKSNEGGREGGTVTGE